MNTYKHSVSLDESKCKGCTTCLKRCPTEAIRIREGRAVISSVRCIDCGECIRVCPHKAKRAIHDPLSSLGDYRFTVALPAPSLYGQFDNLDNIGYVLEGLRRIGFDEVFEVAKAAEIVSAYTRLYLSRPGTQKPVISSACPVITRMISMNYPCLCDRVMPVLPPVDIAAMLAREKVLREHPELSSSDVGIFFISPCPAKASYVKNGFAGDKNNIDRVVSVRDVYFQLLDAMKHMEEPECTTESGLVGIGWASTGGEAAAIFNERYLAADGIENCVRVLDQLDTEEIPMVDYVELNACSGGCVGGAMTVANPYIAQARLQNLKRGLPVSPNRPGGATIPESMMRTDELAYNPNALLSEDRGTAMRMMHDIEDICRELPGMDCGSCGAPTCTAFAEDIIKGETTVDECTVIMRELFHQYLRDHEEKSVAEGLSPLKKSDTNAPSDGR